MASVNLQNPILKLLEELKFGIEHGLDEHYKDKETIVDLEQDLLAYKSALKNALHFEKLYKANKTQENRVTALIDGDGCIFLDELLLEGKVGGIKAARILSSAIRDSVSVTCPDAIINVTIFYNKKGLFSALSKSGLSPNIDDFATGVNQASERCLMIDVGSEKEAADFKIRAFMDDTLRDPRTFKVFFGGCHDNGYASFIQSLITHGFGDKIVLLPGYTEIAAGLRSLDLPTLTVPNLFMKDKINNSPKLAFTTLPSTRNVISPSQAMGNFSPSTSPQSYSLVTTKPILAPTTERTLYPRRGSQLSKRINPDIPLSKHKPPPCTLFYLADNCKMGTLCNYAHDYILEDHHYEEMRANAKKGPCPMLNKGEVCTWAENCVYGHKCPQGPTCYYVKLGHCKFKHPSMHKD